MKKVMFIRRPEAGNVSYAVMAQRVESKDSLDDFPTPPWATRALMEYVVSDKNKFIEKTCLEPACGAGHMVKVLKEYFGNVFYSDIFDYGCGQVNDFMSYPIGKKDIDWIVTNPPFRLSEEFIIHALKIANEGVAILARTVFIESIGRYQRLFESLPPTKFAQFAERVPMVKGRLNQKASTATGYAWLVWEKGEKIQSRLMWIPPCRKMLERDGDYEEMMQNVASYR